MEKLHCAAAACLRLQTSLLPQPSTSILRKNWKGTCNGTCPTTSQRSWLRNCRNVHLIIYNMEGESWCTCGCASCTWSINLMHQQSPLPMHRFSQKFLRQSLQEILSDLRLEKRLAQRNCVARQAKENKKPAPAKQKDTENPSHGVNGYLPLGTAGLAISALGKAVMATLWRTQAHSEARAPGPEPEPKPMLSRNLRLIDWLFFAEYIYNHVRYSCSSCYWDRKAVWTMGHLWAYHIPNHSTSWYSSVEYCRRPVSTTFFV